VQSLLASSISSILLLPTRDTRAEEIRCYSQNEIKTQTRSNVTNKTDLLITSSNKGMRKQQQERE